MWVESVADGLVGACRVCVIRISCSFIFTAWQIQNCKSCRGKVNINDNKYKTTINVSCVSVSVYVQMVWSPKVSMCLHK